MNYIKYFIVVVISVFFTQNISAQNNEYLLKAGFIGKFAEFTQWPDANEQVFIVQVLGKSPFGNKLEQVYNNMLIHNKIVKIEYISNPSQISSCHLLFVCKSEEYRYNKIIELTRAKPILTVADSPNFATLGGHVNFYITKKQTIHFQVNSKMLSKSKLKMDVMLLNYAAIVK